MKDRSANGKILLVEDDRSMARLIQAAYAENGYMVRHTEEAEKALVLLREENFDLILLDVNLPGISGFTFLKLLKETPKTAGLPVIMLTVLGEEEHRVRGLKSGADDYLPKPFSTKELLARTAALLRRVRREGAVADVLTFKELAMDMESHEVRLKGDLLPLRPREYTLLALLLRNEGKILSLAQLAKELSSNAPDITRGTLKAHIKNLRAKLGPYRGALKTVKGVGYKIDPGFQEPHEPA